MSLGRVGWRGKGMGDQIAKSDIHEEEEERERGVEEEKERGVGWGENIKV